MSLGLISARRDGATVPAPRAMRMTLVAAALLAFAAGCQTAPKPDPAALRSAIDAANRQFMTAFTQKDGAALGLLYTEDAIAFPPGAVQVEGRAAIETMWKSMLSLPLSDVELKTAEVGGGVETAWESGHYRILRNDGSVADTGNYVVIWKETAGGWKIYRDIWNSNAPSATPAAETPPPPQPPAGN